MGTALTVAALVAELLILHLAIDAPSNEIGGPRLGTRRCKPRLCSDYFVMISGPIIVVGRHVEITGT